VSWAIKPASHGEPQFRANSQPPASRCIRRTVPANKHPIMGEADDFNHAIGPKR
jgi:hypothetical protein